MLLEPISGHRRLSGKDDLGPYLEYNKGPDGGRAAVAVKENDNFRFVGIRGLHCVKQNIIARFGPVAG